MGIGLKRGAGGPNPLNFKVVGGTSAPAEPRENMIWVNTDQKITSYFFSKTQPTGTEGMVWISTGFSSNVAFNALKKNCITVYPISASQYVSGAWVEKPAVIYQNGGWTDWKLYLYNLGDECIDITGGWVARAVPQESGGTGVLPTITRNSGSIVFKFTGTGGKAGAVNLANKITFTGKKTIKVYGTASGVGTEDSARLRVWSALGSYSDAYVVAEKNLQNLTNFSTTPATISLTGLSAGSYYFGLALEGYSSALPVVTITKIEVE